MGRARRLLEMAEMQARYRGFKHVFLFYGYNEAPRFVLDWYERSGYKRVSFNPEKKIVLLTKNLI
jgi:N-acetylglutamate synthase-like GNAT family acetyltransferase